MRRLEIAVEGKGEKMTLRDGTKLYFERSRYICNKRLSVDAYDSKNDEPYANVTINIPDFEVMAYSIFNPDCNALVDEMIEQGYVKIHYTQHHGWMTYRVGEFTDKIYKETRSIIEKSWILQN